MPRFALVIVAAALLAFYGNRLPDPAWCALAPLALCGAIGDHRRRLLWLGAAAYLWSAALLQAHLGYRLAPENDQRIAIVTGIVGDLPRRGAGRIGIVLEPLSIDGIDGRLPRRIRLAWYQDSIVPAAGETWQFEARLRRPDGRANFVGFDFDRWQFAHGIDASGYIRRSAHNRRIAAAATFDVDTWRGRLAAAIDRYCPRCAQRGLIKALVLGDRADIDAAQREILQRSGTAHLLAISGLHVGLVALFGYALGRAAWRTGLHRFGWRRRTCAAFSAGALACVYAALAGFSLPTLRALLMLAVVLLALARGSRVELLQSVALAVCLIVLADPRAVGTSSFWLSVGAVLVIAFAGFRYLREKRVVHQLVALQVLFTILFAPVGLLIFDRLNPASLAANLVAIPAVSCLILPVALIAGLAAFGGMPGAGVLLELCDRMLAALLGYLGWLESGWLASLPLAGIPPALLLAALPALGLLLLPRGLGAWAATLALLGVLACWRPERPPHGEFVVDVLDVGMGTSVLVRTRHHSLIYDLGPGKPDAYSAADWALLPLLESRRIALADLLVVSHVDADHSGGLWGFDWRQRARSLVSGTPRELAARFGLESPPRACHGYSGWRWDGVGFRFLDATAGDRRGTNARSCVLQINARQRVLLPGDIEADGEARLVRRYRDGLASDLLVTPHHGSETSSSPAFVAATRPVYVVHTVARGNRWKFPREAVVKRYAAAGSTQFRSDRDGAVRFHSGAEGSEIDAARRPPRRLWRRW